MKSSPSRNACAKPSGPGCTVYDRRTPHREPSPSRCSKFGRSFGIEITRTSRIPAIINALNG